MRRVKFENTEAYFHGFFNTSDGEIIAVVEKMDGRVTYMGLHQVEFLDSPGKRPTPPPDRFIKEDGTRVYPGTQCTPGSLENGTY